VAGQLVLSQNFYRLRFYLFKLHHLSEKIINGILY